MHDNACRNACPVLNLLWPLRFLKPGVYDFTYQGYTCGHILHDSDACYQTGLGKFVHHGLPMVATVLQANAMSSRTQSVSRQCERQCAVRACSSITIVQRTCKQFLPQHVCYHRVPVHRS